MLKPTPLISDAKNSTITDCLHKLSCGPLDYKGKQSSTPSTKQRTNSSDEVADGPSLLLGLNITRYKYSFLEGYLFRIKKITSLLKPLEQITFINQTTKASILPSVQTSPGSVYSPQARQEDNFDLLKYSLPLCRCNNQEQSPKASVPSSSLITNDWRRIYARKSKHKTSFFLVSTAHCLKNPVCNLERAPQHQIRIFSFLFCTNPNNRNSDSWIFKLNYSPLS